MKFSEEILRSLPEYMPAISPEMKNKHRNENLSV
ncbi:hypothetical protein BPC006_II2427 [Burkholderia pseudomallei BPC006]|nr:hypothetical protein BPC006_II2427 [Burkholderia pseudomallei BPC006]